MHVPQQRLAVAAVAPVGQRIVVDRTVEISRKFGKHRKGPIRLPHPEQQLLNEILGERGIARERRRIGTERLVVTGVELLPGNGLLPVDPAHELFRFRWSYLHDNLFRLVQNERCNEGFARKYKYFEPYIYAFRTFFCTNRTKPGVTFFNKKNEPERHLFRIPTADIINRRKKLHFNYIFLNLYYPNHTANSYGKT